MLIKFNIIIISCSSLEVMLDGLEMESNAIFINMYLNIVFK